MPKHVVSIGDLVLDVILPVQLPVLSAQHQQPLGRRIEPGGAASFLVAARRMGIKVSAAAAVGDDPFGALLVDMLNQEDINTSYVQAVPGSTTTLVIVLTDQETGEHVFLGNYGEGGDVPYPAKLDSMIARADALFMMGYTLAEKRVVPMAFRSIESAVNAQIPVYIDAGPFLKSVPEELIRRAVRQTSLLLMTEEEIPLVASGRTGQAALDQLLDEGPSVLVIKQGAAGCKLVTKDGQWTVPGYPAKVVDTVGAGDCFAGAFVAGQLRGLDLYDSARLANAMGAAAVQKVGAGRNAPTYDEVMAVLKRAGEGIDFPC